MSPDAHPADPAKSEKHLQLGWEVGDDDRTPIPEHLHDALWADACTVEEFTEQLDALRGAHPLELWELARLRHEGAHLQ